MSSSSESTVSPPAKVGLIRRLYNWVLHWAKTPYGGVALFLLALAESSFFPIPPDVLLIALVLGARHKAFRYALTCSGASLIGGMLGYAIGHWVWWADQALYPDLLAFSAVGRFFFEHIPGFTVDLFDQVRVRFQEYDWLIVFTAGFTPIPYKVITISAGAFGINFIKFLLASAVGRSARFFLVAALLWRWGEPMERFIDRYFNWLAIGFVLLLILGILALKLV